jgi:hypothetical protein
MLLILSVSVIIALTWWTLHITESLPSLNHSLAVFRENCLPTPASYGHPVTLLAGLSIDLVAWEILRGVDHSLMCPVCSTNHTIVVVWWRKTLRDTSNKGCVRFLSTALIVDLRLLKLQFLLWLLSGRIVIIFTWYSIVIEDARSCIV